jgi:hypothetical protein
VIVVPFPISLRIPTVPFDCVAKSCTMLRPRPVPIPIPFVVKNGSNAFYVGGHAATGIGYSKSQVVTREAVLDRSVSARMVNAANIGTELRRAKIPR